MDFRVTPPPNDWSAAGSRGQLHGHSLLTAAEQQQAEGSENSSADKRESSPLHYRGLFSLAIMGIFTSWLLPLHRMPVPEDAAGLLQLLMLLAAGLLAWGCIRLPRLVQAGGQFLQVFLAWFYLCAQGEGTGWLKIYSVIIREDAWQLLSGRISALSEDSRLLILVLGWGLLVTSVQQLALYRGSITLFTGVTLIYLLALDIVYSVDTGGEVLAAAGLILWIRSLGRLQQLRESTGKRRLPYIRWGVWAFSAAAAVTLAAWSGGLTLGARPAAAVTLQPVLSKLEHWAAAQATEEPSGGSLTGSTGYGTGDVELGMPLSPGKEPVFTVTAARPSYWRGESMAYYDGRRWIRSGTAYMPLSLTGLPVVRGGAGNAALGASEAGEVRDEVEDANAAEARGGADVADVKEEASAAADVKDKAEESNRAGTVEVAGAAADVKDKAGSSRTGTVEVAGAAADVKDKTGSSRTGTVEVAGAAADVKDKTGSSRTGTVEVAGAAASASGGHALLVQRVQFAIPSSGGLPLFSAGTAVDVQNIRLADGSRLGYILVNSGKNSFRLPEVSGPSRVTEYTVKSELPESNPEVLRKQHGEDPEAVRSLYLQLPAGLPERVKILAGQLTAAAGNRYDAAAAITDYLRTGYTYTLKTQVPPSGADFSDDFLFETRQGYCVHFATAMTVLLRASGIPARYVQGYGPGTLVAGSMPQRYSVTQGDAHAWVEVYFPGAGWVPFDPTPSAATAAAAGPAEALPAAPAPPPGLSAAQHADALTAAQPQAGGTAPAPPAAAALMLAAAIRWRRSLALLPAARRAGRLGRERQLRAAALAWHGLAARYGPPQPGVTAREYSDSLAIEDRRLRAAVRDFVRQWETLAYSSPAGTGSMRPRPPAITVRPGHARSVTTALSEPPVTAAGSPRSLRSGTAAHPPPDVTASPQPPRSTAKSLRSLCSGKTAHAQPLHPRTAVYEPPQPQRHGASEPASTLDTEPWDAAAFMARCLLITFRLT